MAPRRRKALAHRRSRRRAPRAWLGQQVLQFAHRLLQLVLRRAPLLRFCRPFGPCSPCSPCSSRLGPGSCRHPRPCVKRAQADERGSRRSCSAEALTAPRAKRTALVAVVVQHRLRRVLRRSPSSTRMPWPCLVGLLESSSAMRKVGARCFWFRVQTVCPSSSRAL